MADQLSVSLTDSYMMGVLRSNLLKEIQHELLHEHINSVAELRQAVRRHEIFKQQIARLPNFNTRSVQKKIINELTEQADNESESEVAQEEEVAAIEFVYWNCSKKGHRYHDCRAERRVFCYGCVRQIVPNAKLQKTWQLEHRTTVLESKISGGYQYK